MAATGVFSRVDFWDEVFWCGDADVPGEEFLLPAPIRSWDLAWYRRWLLATTTTFQAIEDGMVRTTKDPGATEDFTFDWANVIGAATIASITWTVPMGITKVSSSNTTTTTTIRLSSGTNDLQYNCPCTVTLSDARVLVCTLQVAIFPN